MEFDFDKAVSAAHLEAAGWGLDAFYYSNPFESHALYVRDFRNGHTRMFSIPQSDFEQIKLPLSITPQMLASVVAEFLLQLADGTLGANEEPILAPALVGYVKATETYRSWLRVASPNERLHLALNIYPAGDRDGFLRPLIIRSEKTILPAEEVLAQSDRLKEMDRARHPSWFIR